MTEPQPSVTSADQDEPQAAPVEDASTQTTPVEEASTQDTPVEETSSEEPSPEPAPEPEPIADEQVPSEEVPSDQAAADEVVTDETPAAPADEVVTDEPPAESAADQAPASAPTPKPVPRPVPRPPGPGVLPRAVTPATVAPSAPAPPDLSEAELAEAASWGRVDEDGTVHVREESGERVVGQFPGADPAEALAFYVRRYADLNAKVELFRTRLSATDLSVKEMDTTLDHLAEELAEPAAVGDLDGLRRRLTELREIAGNRREAIAAERAAAKEAATEARTAIVEAAEAVAGTDPAKMQWRPAGEKLRSLLDQWKEAQRSGPRIDKTTEDALWKRFSHARSTFDRERRRFFAELEKLNAEAKAEKEGLVAEAEALATSTDWGATSAAYRDLMTRWKAAGRASRKDDDALWARFRAAQDAFFTARNAHHEKTDAEYSANLEDKLALLDEAEKLVPVREPKSARATLRDILERWERAGKVPRAEVQRVEARLRAVEQAVRDAERDQWQRTNPETRARAEGAAAQLTAAITALESDLAAAREAGDERKAAELQDALDARRAWLEQVERAAAESRG